MILNFVLKHHCVFIIVLIFLEGLGFGDLNLNFFLILFFSLVLKLVISEKLISFVSLKFILLFPFDFIIFLLKESEDFNLLFLYMKCLIKFKF